VPIRFRLDAASPADVHVQLLPLAEAILSLHVLLHPQGHPLQHPWVRRARTLSPVLKKEIRRFAFLYDDAFPDCFLPARAGASPSFDDGLAAFLALPPEQAAYELARPLYHYAHGGEGPADLERTEVRGWMGEQAARFGPESAELARELLEEPARVRGRAADLLAAYWAESFAEEWERLQPALEQEAERLRASIDGGGLLDALAGHAPQLRLDREARVAIRRSPHAHEVAVGPDGPLLLAPSAYVWPHVRANCDAPWPLALVVPAKALRRRGKRRRPPAALPKALRAVADDTRLQILRLAAERPRTTEELVPLLGLSKSGLSKHLRVLTEAGLLSTRREGWYVLYRLERERFEGLTGELLDWVVSP
jgi:DNA-binding transcriptional ArsR family regulator